MSKKSSAKYCQENKKTTKKAPERYHSLSKEKKEKSDNLVVTDTKICQKMKHKSMLSIKKYIIK